MQVALTDAEAADWDIENVKPGQQVTLNGGQYTVGAVMHVSGNGKSEWVLALEEVA